jgi:DNA-binding transcriptional LysR family regulator
MTLKQLEAFYWTATLGNFAAAARLHLTASTLSKRIAELETEFDTRLFNRSTQRALPTAAGERLVEHARQMLHIKSQIKTDLTTTTTIRGNCRFGISELVALTWFPRFAKRVQALYPELVLEPHVDLTERCVKRLERGELDFAIIPGPSESSALLGERICTLDYAWTASPERLPADTLLTARHFTDHPVILLEPEAMLTRIVNSWALQRRLEIRRALTCNSVSALIELTIAGVGISFFPLVYVDPLIRKGVLAKLVCDSELPKLHYHFQCRRDDSRLLLPTLRQLAMEEADFRPPARI